MQTGRASGSYRGRTISSGRGRGRGNHKVARDEHNEEIRMVQLLKPENQWRLLHLHDGFGAEDELERLSGYQPGGYHPVHLHDTFDGGRYRVMHKLGYGGFSTVWLCRDTEVEDGYVAVKVLMAREDEQCRELAVTDKLKQGHIASERVCLPLRRFDLHGPNGRHICLVYPVLGPTVGHLAKSGRDDDAEEEEEEDDDDDAEEEEEDDDEQVSGATLREVSKQVVQALAALHDRGICHGDFRPSNILLKLQHLDGLDEEQVIESLGEPEIATVIISKSVSSTTTLPHVPENLMYPIDYDTIDPSLISTEAYITDFGQSFDISSHPLPTDLGIPIDYRAPEIALNQPAGVEMDLWSLGCTLFEIRTGQKLFNVFQLMGFDEEEYLLEISSVLGKPPAWSWLVPWHDRLSASKVDLELGTSDGMGTSRDERCQAIRGRLEAAQRGTEKDGHLGAHIALSEDETGLLADLLEKLLRWVPEKRLGAREVLEHGWFKM